jgi:hypothetical protein
MQQLNSRTILLIQNSEWFRPYALEFLRLHECRKPYEILERIWLNVSSKCGRSWKDIYNAKQVNCELFAELCVALILIQRALKEHAKFNDEDVEELLGARFSQIIHNCYEKLGKI